MKMGLMFSLMLVGFASSHAAIPTVTPLVSSWSTAVLENDDPVRELFGESLRKVIFDSKKAQSSFLVFERDDLPISDVYNREIWRKALLEKFVTGSVTLIHDQVRFVGSEKKLAYFMEFQRDSGADFLSKTFIMAFVKEGQTHIIFIEREKNDFQTHRAEIEQILTAYRETN